MLSIYLLLNIWTSLNRLLFLGICAHFVNQGQEKQLKALLALCTVANYSKNKQFATLLPVLKDNGIIQKLRFIVYNNASLNNTLITKQKPISQKRRRLNRILYISGSAIPAILLTQPYKPSYFTVKLKQNNLSCITNRGEKGMQEIKRRNRQPFRLQDYLVSFIILLYISAVLLVI